MTPPPPPLLGTVSGFFPLVVWTCPMQACLGPSRCSGRWEACPWLHWPHGASTQIVSSTFMFLPRMALPPATPLTLRPSPSPSPRGFVSVFSHGEGETLWCPDLGVCFPSLKVPAGVRGQDITPPLGRAPVGAAWLYPPSGQLLLVSSLCQQSGRASAPWAPQPQVLAAGWQPFCSSRHP